MNYNFDELPDRKRSESIKWHYFDEDVLPMWVADMDFVSPEPVIRALQERVAQGVFGYAGELPGLREVIIERMAATLPMADRGAGPGFCTRCGDRLQRGRPGFCGPGEGLLIQPPVYMPFLSTARNVDGLSQEALLSARVDGYYHFDCGRL